MANVPLPEEIRQFAVPAEPATAAVVLKQLKAIQGVFKDPLADVAEPTGRSTDLDDALSDLKNGHDGVACFNHLYKVITAEINNKINEGFFSSKGFLNQFDAVFADRYFDAMQRYMDQSEDRPAPKCWQLLFENRDSEISPMQFAIDGVVCHVWMDLPIAVVQVCKDTGKSLDDIHDDFQKVNEIFHEKIPKLRKHFEDPHERKVDRSIVRHIVNHACDFIVVHSRNIAWKHATELWDVWDSPDKREKEKLLDNHASYICRGILGIL
jgi:hypothetical protein